MPKNIMCINSIIKQINFSERRGICYAIKKGERFHKDRINFFHPKKSFEIRMENTMEECVEFFNNNKWFVCYDPLSFYIIVSALCGCIPVVAKLEGVSKKEWIQKTAAAEYIKYNNLENLYGIAYGQEDMQYAIDTLHLVKDQWDDIINFCANQTFLPFIREIKNFDGLKNSIEKIYFSEIFLDKNVYGVYFICCINNYLEVVEEQLTILEKGLLNITNKLIIFITNYKNNNTELDELLLKFNKNNKFVIIASENNLYEKFAINNYKKYIEDADYYIYYFHTKGLKEPNDPLLNIFTSRRKLLNYYTLEKFYVNIILLKDYDAVGCSLNLYPKKHFSGNFWWSKSEHVNTLSPTINDNYLSPEMYILDNNNCKCISLANDTNLVLFENYIFRNEFEILNNATTEIIVEEEFKSFIDRC
jgi:hypothetical protein